jgi:hypothetical protein
MMGERAIIQDRLFYEFRLEEHVPGGHLLRIIDRFVDLSDLRRHLAGFYSSKGQPSVAPELMMCGPLSPTSPCVARRSRTSH